MLFIDYRLVKYLATTHYTSTTSSFTIIESLLMYNCFPLRRLIQGTLCLAIILQYCYTRALINKATFLPSRIKEVLSNRATSLIGPVILVPRVAPLTRFHCITKYRASYVYRYL